MEVADWILFGLAAPIHRMAELAMEKLIPFLLADSADFGQRKMVRQV